MTLEIKVGPPLLTINQGYTVMVSEPDGQILQQGDLGLYFLDTRLISLWALYADGVEWKLLSGGSLASCAARVVCTNPPILTAAGAIPADTLGLTFGRHIDGGMREDFEIENFGQAPARFNLELAIRSDFADLFEVKAKRLVRRGKIRTAWSSRRRELVTVYENGDFSRALRISTAHGGPALAYANGRLSFDVEIKPGRRWGAALLYAFADGDSWSDAPQSSVAGYLSSEASRAQSEWEAAVAKIETSDDIFRKAFHQSIRDMSALRLPIAGTGDTQFVPAAGLPWFLGLFGRDSLIISLQNAIVHPEFAQATLDVLARRQATERDDFRDAEPGKIMHELRRGELAHFKMIPHTPYYGTADATPLYLVTLHSTWLATGKRELLEQHLETAERCLAWIDDYGDRDGDGFQEYQTRSSEGYENQGWKDAGDAVLYEDGSPVKGPKALCELQGYVFDAWLRMAEVFDALGRAERAAELREKADTLYRSFNQAFWNEAEGFYAFALDGYKRPVWSVASNPGHCLWSGIVPPERARRVVDRLMSPDMWSGWGIRTLSADHPGFNPFSYQNGSVWPHDNGFIALGMKRYGFETETFRIAEAVREAAKYFAMDQLPELYAGLDSKCATFPIQYLGANVPQGWAAGSIFSLLQAMLGFQPDGPNDLLYVDPALPEWMPDLVVRNLRVGNRSFDLRFTRNGQNADFEVLKGDAGRVLRRPARFQIAGHRCGERPPPGDGTIAVERGAGAPGREPIPQHPPAAGRAPGARP